MLVAVCQRRLILIPILEGGPFLAEHEGESLIKDAKYVSHVARVLQARPLVRAGTSSDTIALKQWKPLGGVLPDLSTDVVTSKRRCIESAVPTGSLQDPRPVLRVGRDRHVAMLGIELTAEGVR
jgi:hypothetical protein